MTSLRMRNGVSSQLNICASAGVATLELGYRVASRICYPNVCTVKRHRSRRSDRKKCTGLRSIAGADAAYGRVELVGNPDISPIEDGSVVLTAY